MKKLLFTFICTIFILNFTACSEDDIVESSTIRITVKENGVAKGGISVLMFDNLKGPSTNFFTPKFADRTVITESNGLATFKLQDIYDLNAIESQSTFYFGIFDGDSIIGSTAVTIEKGETKSGSINL